VDDEPFDVRYGELHTHQRVLDLRAGTLTRDACWTSPAGRKVRLRSTRLVSLAQRGVAAIEYVVEALDEYARVTVQSELVANEDQPRPSADPRVAAVLLNPLEPVQHGAGDREAFLVHRTRGSQLMMAAAMDHLIEVPGRVEANPKPVATGRERRSSVGCGQASSCASSSFSPTDGRACDRAPRCATRCLAR
jgi:alpha,alpha-trehalose phosphorylase